MLEKKIFQQLMSILCGRAKELGLVLKCAKLLSAQTQRNFSFSATAMRGAKNPVQHEVSASWNSERPEDPSRNSSNKLGEYWGEQSGNRPLPDPDFLPSYVWNRRDPIYEELVHVDMMERRLALDIPEFYVGSIMAVTTSDPNLGSKKNRFVGICISRNRVGLHHQFTLRNVIDGLGVEVMYELYNPTILKIETLKLEKRLDDDLSYLVDALPQYSTFDFNLEPIAHPPGTPVPINPVKVKMRPPPWKIRWALYDFKGIDDSWTLTTPYFKRKLVHKTKVDDLPKYDIVRHYRDNGQELEHDLMVEERIKKFEMERHKTGHTKRRILKLVSMQR